MLRFSRIALVAAAALCGASSAWAGWQDEASHFDTNRLAKLDESRAKALSEAQSGRDIGLIRAVLDAAARPTSARALEGDWRCRTIKLGGMSPDVVYSWFRCRIGRRGDHLYFSKLNGTQRLNAVLYPHESGGFVALGGLSAKGEAAHRYSGNGPSAGASATPDDAIGLLQSTGRSSARIEFPYPVQESTLDIIELRR